jgi:hypothetical protein
LVGNVIGGGITLAVSIVFYMLVAKGLKREADDLRRLNLTLVYLLDGAGVIEVKEWDRKTGEPKRWRVTQKLETLWQVEASLEDSEEDESNEERS